MFPALRWIGLAILAAVLLCMAGGVVLCEGALHVPKRPPQASFADSSRLQPVEIKARDGSVLRAWLLSPAGANGDCVITLHGIGDSRTGTAGLARLFAENHYKVLMPDSRAHGESGGAIVTYGLLESDDLHRWVDWLMSSEHPRNVFAMGESFGGAVLLQSLSIERRFRAVVAECPFTNLEDIAAYRVAQRLPMPPRLARLLASPMVSSAFIYARWKYGMDFRAARPDTAVYGVSTPILLIHGVADTNTPPVYSQVIAARNRGIALWLAPGALHTGAFAAAPDEFKMRVLAWFSDHSGGTASPAGGSLGQ